jgi:hypothetical protein
MPGGNPVTEVPGDTPTLPEITLLPVFVTAEPARTAKLAAEFRGTADAAKEHAADSSNMLKVFKKLRLTDKSWGSNVLLFRKLHFFGERDQMWSL